MFQAAFGYNFSLYLVDASGSLVHSKRTYLDRYWILGQPEIGIKGLLRTLKISQVSMVMDLQHCSSLLLETM